MGWTKVISSPTWSNWPCAVSSSSRMKLDAASGESSSASFNSRPTSGSGSGYGDLVHKCPFIG